MIDPSTIRDPRTISNLRAQGWQPEDLHREILRVGQKVELELIEAVWRQPILDTPNNGFWLRLEHIELDPKRVDPRKLVHTHNTSTLDPGELYSQDYIEYLKTCNIWIDHVQIFHRWGDQEPNNCEQYPAHTDTSDWGQQAAINYVVGEDTGTMYWYDLSTATRTGVHELSQTDRSIEYTTSAEPIHTLSNIGSTLTLVRTDIPHRVFAPQERLCVSWRLANCSTWQAHVDSLIDPAVASKT
jgi:hypothetical protein